jgi:hypothetical protein
MNYKQNGLALRFEAEKVEILALSFLASTWIFFDLLRTEEELH